MLALSWLDWQLLTAEPAPEPLPFPVPLPEVVPLGVPAWPPAPGASDADALGEVPAAEIVPAASHAVSVKPVRQSQAAATLRRMALGVVRMGCSFSVWCR